ncbi:MAG: aminotransferase class I/II-fold pyridoxal phosphate-dependent enzyme [Bacteroidetes bacterium]|nr:aminotransferase class I/II-fold pyridoxal phosphate-dependent enzyme [Bacteroidota bacterium]
MIHKPARRIEAIEPSIFATMSRLAIEHAAVNLGQGFPDFDGPSWIVEAFAGALRSEKNQYAPMHGTARLRKAVAAYQQKFYGLEWNAETEITVTAGATEALFSSMLALLDEGDEVILFEPFYDSYYANALIAGATPVCVTLHAPSFRIDEAALNAAITGRTRMIVFNNPHNPTGRVFSQDEMNVVAACARRHNLLVLSDEVYEFLTFDGKHHTSFASLPGMRTRTVSISSTGKTFGMTGWKIGFAMATGNLTNAIRTVHQFATFAVNTPAQHAMAHGLEKLHDYLPDFRILYQQKRDMLLRGLEDSILKPITPEGTYFMMVQLPSDVGDDVQCATRLVTERQVAVIPPSVFYRRSTEGQRMLRLCFAKKEETLLAGIARLQFH